MSSYLDRKMTEVALNMVSPSVELSLTSVAKRNAGHLRVTHKRGDGTWELLGFRDFGNRKRWEHNYEAHAIGKEEISQRTGLPTREVQNKHAELLEPGDTVYFGSVVSDDGTIVIAFSGVEAFFDEMFAKWLLAAILALIEKKVEELKASTTGGFLPEA